MAKMDVRRVRRLDDSMGVVIEMNFLRDGREFQSLKCFTHYMQMGY